MSDANLAPIPILPGSLLVDEAGNIVCAEDLTEVPEGVLVVVNRWFIGENHALPDGTECLRPLTPYYYSLAACEVQYDSLKALHPGCAILKTHTLVDTEVPSERAGLLRYMEHIATERRTKMQ